MSKYKSCAEWDPKVDPGRVTSDLHETYSAAQAVCAGLRQHGFAGEGKHFPKRTWSEPGNVRIWWDSNGIRHDQSPPELPNNANFIIRWKGKDWSGFMIWDELKKRLETFTDEVANLQNFTVEEG